MVIEAGNAFTCTARAVLPTPPSPRTATLQLSMSEMESWSTEMDERRGGMSKYLEKSKQAGNGKEKERKNTSWMSKRAKKQLRVEKGRDVGDTREEWQKFTIAKASCGSWIGRNEQSEKFLGKISRPSTLPRYGHGYIKFCPSHAFCPRICTNSYHLPSICLVLRAVFATDTDISPPHLSLFDLEFNSGLIQHTIPAF
jgi:hypothetical protein